MQREATQLHPIFRACCREPDDRFRYKISEPFSEGEFIYATDGRICVRRRGEWDNGERCVPPIANLLNDFDKSRYVDEPCDVTVLEPEETNCDTCDGTGCFKECGVCDGMGEIECSECGSYVDCYECDGDESGPCPDCGATGRVMKHVPCPIGDTFISSKYARLLTAHGAQMYPSREAPNKPIYFIIGPDIEGLVMPVVNREDSHAHAT